MGEFPDKSVDDWRQLAEKDLKGGSPDDLVWQTPEGIAAHWEAITSPEGETTPQAGFEQTVKFTGMAAHAQGIDLS